MCFRRSLSCGIALLLHCLAVPPVADARTWRVPSELAFIQQAVDSAQAGDDVLLAPGVYGWTGQGSSPSMVRMKSGVLLHSESGASGTVLDGEGRGRLLLCEGTTGVVVEGLTFENGLAPSTMKVGNIPADHLNRFGGAIWSTVPSSITLRNCVFRNNRVQSGQSATGGAVYCDSGEIDGCTFEDNFVGPSDSGGGALRMLSGVVSSCVFRRNKALGDFTASGGAVSGRGITVQDCIFEDNGASAFRISWGGAVLLGTGAGTNRVERCLFARNTVRTQDGLGGGGGLAIIGGEVAENVFVSNKATAVFFASASGGALYSFEGTNVARCMFLGNQSVREGPPGLGIAGAAHFSLGGGLSGCTVVGNSGITTVHLNSVGTVANSIVALNAGSACGGGMTHVWSCNDVWGNTGGDALCGVDGGSNISADPLFCSKDPVAARSVAIQKDSPCAPGLGACGLIGAGAVKCGPVAVQKRSWSQTKGLFR